MCRLAAANTADLGKTLEDRFPVQIEVFASKRVRIQWHSPFLHVGMSSSDGTADELRYPKSRLMPSRLRMMRTRRSCSPFLFLNPVQVRDGD